MSMNSGNATGYLFLELITLKCKECSRCKTCDIKDKPPADCKRFQLFVDANSSIPKSFTETKIFSFIDRQMRINKPVYLD